MMKKGIAMLLASAMVLSMIGCGGAAADASAPAQTATEETKEEAVPAADTADSAEAGGVELNVTTTFAGEDGNAQNFKTAVDEWCAQTGNTIADTSATSDETFKTRVITDFETGSEPDVLFFFNGADANSFIEAGKVVSIDDIRAEYPEYASNMNDDLIADSLV
ncbi:MAG: ABC transporter substrate-binding protein, partial [Lachnospiraceae bacterium]|nr:ABC transporter substrate-binding protein [Lachnospiraceae bacterium]